MEPDAVVRGGDRIRALRSPDVDHAVDRLRAQVWAVAEHDDRSLGLGRQRLETAAKRRAGTALPLRAADRPAPRSRARARRAPRPRRPRSSSERVPARARGGAAASASRTGSTRRPRARPPRLRCGHASRRASSARRTSARASSSLYAVPASGVACVEVGRGLEAHGIGATPDSASRTSLAEARRGDADERERPARAVHRLQVGARLRLARRRARGSARRPRASSTSRSSSVGSR